MENSQIELFPFCLEKVLPTPDPAKLAGAGIFNRQTHSSRAPAYAGILGAILTHIEKAGEIQIQLRLKAIARPILRRQRIHVMELTDSTTNIQNPI